MSAIEMILVLQERFPKAFVALETRRRPLKVGIGEDVHAVAADIDPEALSAGLRYYVGAFAYLRKCTEGAERIGLDGSVAGRVTSGEATFAARELERMKVKARAKAAAKLEPKTESPAESTAPTRLGFAGLREAARMRAAATISK
jgi:ProP effector